MLIIYPCLSYRFLIIELDSISWNSLTTELIFNHLPKSRQEFVIQVAFLEENSGYASCSTRPRISEIEPGNQNHLQSAVFKCYIIIVQVKYTTERPNQSTVMFGQTWPSNALCLIIHSRHIENKMLHNNCTAVMYNWNTRQGGLTKTAMFLVKLYQPTTHCVWSDRSYEI